MAVTLVLVLSSCSLLDGSDTAGRPETSSDGLAFSETVATSTVPLALRDRGGVLRIGVVGSTWDDPAAIDETLPGEQLLADLIFDGLTWIDERGNAAPALASSWTISPDGLLWTFALDEGATFSDGSTIEAEDVKHSLERVLARGAESLAGYRLRKIAEIDSSDPAVIAIRLEQPFAPLAELLAAPIFGIVPVEATDGVVTSSQQLAVTKVDGQVIELKPSAEATAYIDAVTVQRFESDRAAVVGFDSGVLDVAPAASGSTARGRLVSGVDTTMFLMNLGDQSFADASVRRAIILAIDPSFVAAGVARPTTVSSGLLPVEIGGADSCGGCGYSPDVARSLLAELPDGSAAPVFVDHLSDAESAAMAAAIVSDLEFVGFDARSRSHSPTAFAAKLAAGELGLFQFGLVGSWLSPEAYLGDLFETNGVDNVASFSDPQVDRLLAQARSEPDADKRLSLYSSVEQRLIALAVAVPLYQTDFEVSVSDRIRGFRPYPLGAFDLTEVWLKAD